MRRTAAVIGAVTIAGSAGIVALAPAALAGTTTVQAACKVPVIGDKNGPQDVKVDFDKSSGPAGTTVTATVDMGPPPISSPFAFKNAKAQSTLHLAMSGAAEGTIDLAGPEVTLDIPADVPIDPAPFTKTFTIPAGADAGDIAFTPTGSTNVTVLPAPYGAQEAPCTYTGGSSVATFTAEAPPAGSVTLGVTPGTVEPGKAVTLSGVGWPANGTIDKLELCKTDLTGCDAAKFSANTVKIGADGKLAGPATVAANVAEGDYKVQVTSGTGAEAKVQSTALTVKKAPAAVAAITLTPASGKVGTETTVAGTNFPAGAKVKVVGVKADGNVTADTVDATADDKGAFSAKLKIQDKDTAKVKASTDGANADAAFTVESDSTTPPKDPNGKDVSVPYLCKTTVEGIQIPVKDMNSNPTIKIVLPGSGDKDQKVDVSAEFKDKIISDIPDVAGDMQKGMHGNLSPQLTVDVKDDRGNKGTIQLGSSPIDVDMTPGGKMTGGPLTGSFTIPGGGTFSFTPGTLVLTITVPFNGANIKATATCTPTAAVDVSATLTAAGEPGPPPGEQSTGGSSSAATGGDLAKTGSGGSSINAFALAAGTAVLAAVGVLLLVPYRRRLRTRA
ncbi:MAG: hypothetical protein HOU01_15860 [Streptomycetaceae bacterium]|nr:hypothetical protein [Streptomycetaceae bacterium]